MLDNIARVAAGLMVTTLAWILVGGVLGVAHGFASQLHLTLALVLIPTLTFYSARGGWMPLIIDSSLGVAYILLVILASLTGYLPDDNGGFASEEMRNRFVVLHELLLPALLTLLCLRFVWRTWRQKSAARLAHHESA